MWVAGEVTESREQSKHHCSLSDPSPTYSLTKQRPGFPHSGEHLRLHPLLCNRHAETKKKAQMKEQIKAPEKVEPSDKEIANLSDAQFKALVIRMLQELTGTSTA